MTPQRLARASMMEVYQRSVSLLYGHLIATIPPSSLLSPASASSHELGRFPRLCSFPQALPPEIYTESEWMLALQTTQEEM